MYVMIEKNELHVSGGIRKTILRTVVTVCNILYKNITAILIS